MLHILAATQESTPSQTVKFLEVLKRFDAIDTVINYENNKKEVSFIFFFVFVVIQFQNYLLILV